MRFLTLALLLALTACDDGASSDNPGASPDAAPPDAAEIALDATVPPDAAPAPDAAVDAALSCEPGESLAVYTRYIEPLLTDDHPQSCNGCHLPGIDLAALVQGSPCDTMACMLERGLVDFENPGESTLLTWIERGREPPAEASVPPEVVDAEYAGFLAWIEYSAQCHEAACGEPGEAPCGAPAPGTHDAGVDAGVIDLDATVADADPCPVGDCPEPEDMYVGPDFGMCDPEGLLGSFRVKVMRWRGRCEHCHVEGGLLSEVGNPPPWLVFAEEGGGDEASAEATLDSILERGYLDLDRPEYSLLLLKPLKIEAGGLLHAGGTKFLSQEDPAYIDVRGWIERYADCVGPSGDGGVEDGGVEDGGLGDGGLEDGGLGDGGLGDGDLLDAGAAP